MRNRHGVTLLEILTVTALTGVILGAALPTLTSVRGPAALLAGTQRVAAVLRTTRADAIARGRRLQVTLAPLPPTLAVTVGGVPIRQWPLPSDLRIISGPASLSFSASGAAQNATFVLAVGNRQRRVIVNQRGRVRLG